MWSWLEQLKEPVITKEDVEALSQNSHNPLQALSIMDKVKEGHGTILNILHDWISPSLMNRTPNSLARRLYLWWSKNLTLHCWSHTDFNADVQNFFLLSLLNSLNRIHCELNIFHMSSIYRSALTWKPLCSELIILRNGMISQHWVHSYIRWLE